MGKTQSDTFDSGNVMDNFSEEMTECDVCSGSGFILNHDSDEPETCLDCEGKGEILIIK